MRAQLHIGGGAEGSDGNGTPITPASRRRLFEVPLVGAGDNLICRTLNGQRSRDGLPGGDEADDNHGDGGSEDQPGFRRASQGSKRISIATGWLCETRRTRCGPHGHDGTAPERMSHRIDWFNAPQVSSFWMLASNVHKRRITGICVRRDVSAEPKGNLSGNPSRGHAKGGWVTKPA